DRPLIPLLSWRSMSNYFIPTELITTRWTTSGLMPRCCNFFGITPVQKVVPHYQQFDLPSLTGRLLSSSYVPEAGQLGHKEMVQALNRLFEECQVNGRVSFEYDTRIFYARLKRSA